MEELRGYISLTGTGEAFGFCKRKSADVWQAVLGGLQAEKSYTLDDRRRFAADLQGRWQGEIQGEAPLYVAALPEGILTLYDEARISRSDAVLLAKPKAAKRNEIHTMAVVIPEIKKEPVLYRTRLNGEPVDALPALVWPAEAQKLRPCFETGMPVRLLREPGWRFVCVQDTPRCYVGYHAQENRVCELAWAVQARSAMLPPKGLPGCRYTLCADGQACWLLTKTV